MAASAEPLILVVAANPATKRAAAAALEAAGFRVTSVSHGGEAFEAIYTDPPRCLVIEHGFVSASGEDLLQELKSDMVYGHIPAVVLLAEGDDPSAIDWRDAPASDFVPAPHAANHLAARAWLSLARAQRDASVNPLSGLPGNIAIMREIETRLDHDDDFAVAYIDIDNFKSFNDKYGFSRGDEVLRMAARLIVNTARGLDNPDTYVGHVGGDDFILVLPCALAEPICRDFIRHFDQIVPNFYDDEDRVRGGIDSTDRKGAPQHFPIMSCSIAVLDTSRTMVRHVGDISAKAAELKKYAKSLEGSNYLVDRRRD